MRPELAYGSTRENVFNLFVRCCKNLLWFKNIFHLGLHKWTLTKRVVFDVNSFDPRHDVDWSRTINNKSIAYCDGQSDPGFAFDAHKVTGNISGYSSVSLSLNRMKRVIICATAESHCRFNLIFSSFNLITSREPEHKTNLNRAWRCEA